MPRLLSALLHAGVLAGVATPAHALSVPPSGAEDPHIRTTAYSPLNRTRITAVMTHTTTVTYGPAERIARVTIGDDKTIEGPDPGKLQGNPLHNNLPLWPLHPGHTNMQVTTETPDGAERLYQYDVVVHDNPKDDGDDPDAVYGLIYSYPREVHEAAVARARVAQAARQKSAAVDRLSTDFFSGPRNWKYTAHGKDAWLAPAEVSDNSRLTAFRFPGNTQIPSIYVVAKDGSEQLAPFQMRDDLVIVQTVACHFRLRLGGGVLEVFNKGDCSGAGFQSRDRHDVARRDPCDPAVSEAQADREISPVASRRKRLSNRAKLIGGIAITAGHRRARVLVQPDQARGAGGKAGGDPSRAVGELSPPPPVLDTALTASQPAQPPPQPAAQPRLPAPNPFSIANTIPGTPKQEKPEGAKMYSYAVARDERPAAEGARGVAPRRNRRRVQARLLAGWPRRQGDGPDIHDDAGRVSLRARHRGAERPAGADPVPPARRRPVAQARRADGARHRRHRRIQEQHPAGAEPHLHHGRRPPITPYGVPVPLDSPMADGLGRAGLDGAVDNHLWQRFGGGVLLSLVDNAFSLAQSALRSGNGNSYLNFNTSSASSVAEEVLRSTINIPPTITKNQGEDVTFFLRYPIDFSDAYALRTR